MSTGGTATNSASGSPRVGGGGPTIHHRRPVTDNDAEKLSDHIQIGFDNYHGDNNNNNTNIINSGGGNLHYHHHHHHHPRTIIRYLLACKWVPESLIFRVEEWLLSIGSIMACLGSRKNMGRTILGVLLVLVVISVFLKFSIVMNGDVNGNMMRKENGLFVVQNFKNEWVNAQKIVSETESSVSSSSSGGVARKRQMKELPVSSL